MQRRPRSRRCKQDATPAVRKEAVSRRPHEGTVRSSPRLSRTSPGRSRRLLAAHDARFHPQCPVIVDQPDETALKVRS